MPRFGTKSLLFIFAVIALWLSTFTDYAAADDVRKSLMLIILLSAMFGAIYSREKRRAFWAGFFLVMLISCLHKGVRQYFIYFPAFGWRNYITNMIITYDRQHDHLYWAVDSTVREALNLILALIVGSIAAYIYHQTKQPHSTDRR